MRFVASLFFLAAALSSFDQSTAIHGEGKWVYHTATDQMTDAVTHTLNLEADAPSDGDDGTKRPFLYISCDSGTQRKLFIHFGFDLTDRNPMLRFDKASENEFTIKGRHRFV